MEEDGAPSPSVPTHRQIQIPELESLKPPDYTPPRGIQAEPGDYRALYVQRKEELAQRAAAAKERIAAAYKQAEELKDARKAKMIDKLVPAKRARCSGAGRGGSSHPPVSAFLHKPRPDSRSSLLSKPSNQVKLLKDLGLIKPPAAKQAATVRIVRPSPVPSAAVGHSSNLAGAALLSRATNGQLGKTSVGGNRGHVEAQPPLVAARAAAVAAAAAAAAGSKRPAAPSQAGGVAKVAKYASGASVSGSGGGGGGPSGSRPDPRVMFPRQPPPGSSPAGGSKFAVPSARPAVLMQPAQSAPPRVAPGAKAAQFLEDELQPTDDLE